jgi:hypothetical protein
MMQTQHIEKKSISLYCFSGKNEKNKNYKKMGFNVLQVLRGL